MSSSLLCLRGPYVNILQIFRISNSTSLKWQNSNRVNLFHVFSTFSCRFQDGDRKYNLHSQQRRSSVSHSFASLSIILLLSGDIQGNPGPKTVKTRTPKYPCGPCGKNVNFNHKAMECEECQVWFHTKCVGMSGVLYQVHIKHNSHSWICCSCGLPNFSSSLFYESDLGL